MHLLMHMCDEGALVKVKKEGKGVNNGRGIS